MLDESTTSGYSLTYGGMPKHQVANLWIGTVVTKLCKCGCGSPISRRKVFVDKVHQLQWMRHGGAKQLNALQPIDAKERGGHISGTRAAESGRLAEAAKLGGAKAREIALRIQSEDPA